MTKSAVLRSPCRRRLTLSEGITAILSMLLVFEVLCDPTAVAASAREGLLLTAHSVIPALFPFFVLSSLLSESKITARLGRYLSAPLRLLFGVSGSGAPVLLLGAFCGFPVGARYASALYGAGEISRGEYERLLPLSSAPSFAFLYTAVGAGYFGDRRFGAVLYCSVLLATAVSGILLRVLFGVSGGALPYKEPSPRSTAARLTGAVSSAVTASLSVAGYVVFFTVVTAALTRLLTSVGSSSGIPLLLGGLLEITSGIKKAAETDSGLCGRVLCGLFAGFGGLCAALQVIATVEHPLPDRAPRERPSLRPYFFSKILSGLLSALFTFLFLRL